MQRHKILRWIQEQLGVAVIVVVKATSIDRCLSHVIRLES